MKNKISPALRNMLIIVLVVALLCGAGWLWNRNATTAEAQDNPPPGKLVEVFDAQMHVYTAGEKTEGEPTIVLISGLGTPSPVADFYPLWSRMQENHRLAVIERPGYGWSSDTRRERNIRNIVEEDRMALEKAGLNPPYLLVAHSLGGFEANYFAAQYPDEVAGVVLIDSTAPELYVTAGGGSASTLQKMLPSLRRIGVLRLIAAVAPGKIAEMSQAGRNNFAFVDEEYKAIDTLFFLQKYEGPLMEKENALRLQNAQEVMANPFPEGLPLRLLMIDSPSYHDHPQYAQTMEIQKSWVGSATDSLALLETQHYIHHYLPEEVIAAVKSVLQEIRFANAG